MAKTKVNKSQLIRDCLKQNPGKSPSEIAEVVKNTHGIKVSGQYVSTVKSNMKPKRRKRESVIVSGVNRVRAVRHDSNGMAGFTEAIAFLKAVGGLSNAKTALAIIEQVQEAL